MSTVTIQDTNATPGIGVVSGVRYAAFYHNTRFPSLITVAGRPQLFKDSTAKTVSWWNDFCTFRFNRSTVWSEELGRSIGSYILDGSNFPSVVYDAFIEDDYDIGNTNVYFHFPSDAPGPYTDAREYNAYVMSEDDPTIAISSLFAISGSSPLTSFSLQFNHNIVDYSWYTVIPCFRRYLPH